MTKGKIAPSHNFSVENVLGYFRSRAWIGSTKYILKRSKRSVRVRKYCSKRARTKLIGTNFLRAIRWTKFTRTLGEQFENSSSRLVISFNYTESCKIIGRVISSITPHKANRIKAPDKSLTR